MLDPNPGGLGVKEVEKWRPKRWDKNLGTLWEYSLQEEACSYAEPFRDEEKPGGKVMAAYVLAGLVTGRWS